MGFYLSAGVYTQEVDLSNIVPAVETSIGAMVGYSARGPVGRHLVTSTKKLIDLYGEPSPGNWLHYSALGFLQRANKLYVSRVVSDARYSGVEIKKDTSQYDNAGIVSGPEDTAGYSFGTDGLMAIFASNPGVWGNNLTVTITNATDPGVAWSSASSSSSTTSSSTSSASSVSSSMSSASSNSSSKSSVSSISSSNSSASSVSSSGNSSSSAVSSASSVSSSDSSASSSATAGLFEFDLSVYELNTDTDTYELRVSQTVSRRDQKDGYGRDQYIGDVFGVESDGQSVNDYIRVIDNTLVPDTVSPKEQLIKLSMSGGDDGSAITSGQIIQAWEDDYANPEDITVNILMSAGYTAQEILQKIDTICQSRKDCIGVLDVPYGEDDADDLVTWRKNTLKIDSSYSAIYSPWLQVYDQYNDKKVFIPPSGHVGSVYAYTDYSTEPWFAPAGMNRGILSVTDLEKVWDLGERDILYSNNLNPIKRASASGVAVVWGQKTLQSKPSALDRVNVRRLLIVLEKSVATALEYWDFEPNDKFTRVFITNMIDGFLRNVQSRRGVYEYRVVCDASNNTGEIIDRNELWVDVYIKPVRAAEFIQLRVVITRTDASFDEVIGALTPQ